MCTFGAFCVFCIAAIIASEVHKHRHNFPQRGGHTHPSYFSSARRINPS
jgi:hypothetical protein